MPLILNAVARLAETVDDTLEDLREVDLQGAFDDALASAQEFDVDAALADAQEAVDQAFDLLKPGGVLMLIGIPEFDSWSLPVDKGRHKEVTIVNVRRQNGAVEETLELLESGTVDVSKMPTHRFAFTDSKKAFDLVASYGDGVMKAMIDF